MVRTLAGTVLAVLVSPCVAQQTWYVSSQDQLLAALQAAQAGDVVQLAAGGAYDDFVLDRGLTLRGPARIGGNLPENGTRQIDVPAGQVVRLVDLTFVPSPVGWNEYPDQGELRISGAAVLDGCQLLGGALEGALVLHNADVVVERCTITGDTGCPGINAVDSRITIHDTKVSGAFSVHTHSYGTAGAPGIRCRGDGTLHASWLTVHGGDGEFFDPYFLGASAPGIDSEVPTWITDSTVAGGTMLRGAFPGADGLVATQARYARCWFTGGGGTPPGQPTAGNVISEPTLLGVRSPAPLLQWSWLSLEFDADQAGVPVALFALPNLARPAVVPPIAQPVWWSAPPLWIATRATRSKSSRWVASFSMLIPVDAALANQMVSFFGARLAGSEVQMSPIAGGVIH